MKTLSMPDLATIILLWTTPSRYVRVSPVMFWAKRVYQASGVGISAPLALSDMSSVDKNPHQTRISRFGLRDRADKSNKVVEINLKNRFWRSIGSGVLFAGAAIGTSHLVQSTRAGAIFGLGLILVVVFANIIKYPGFRFGPFYAAATGKSLIEGYRSIGKWIVVLLLAIQIPVQIIIAAATALTTAALMIGVFGIAVDVKILSCIMLLIGSTVILRGGFDILARVTKAFVVLLTLSTLVSTVMVIPSIEWDFTPVALVGADIETISFVLALCGFMPAALDLSIWHSLWAVEQARSSDQPVNIEDSILDFNVSYIATSVLALCFLIMGAGVMYGAGIKPANNAGEFASQLIGLYTHNLGVLGGTVVGIAAFGVMFTTLITVLDGISRVQAASLATLVSETGRVEQTLDRSRLLYGAVLFSSISAAIVILYFLTGFTVFIDIVTITAFVVAPVIATFNHWVVYHLDVPESLRPGDTLRMWSIVAIVIMMFVSLYFIGFRFL